ncbi:MAG: hypothetical protein ABIP35_12750 [Ginsengibacter sp.]
MERKQMRNSFSTHKMFRWNIGHFNIACFEATDILVLQSIN